MQVSRPVIGPVWKDYTTLLNSLDEEWSGVALSSGITSLSSEKAT